MPTITTNPIAQNLIPDAIAVQSDAMLLGRQTVSGTPTTLEFSIGLLQAYFATGLLQAANNLSDLINPTTARANLGAEAIFFTTAAPDGTTGIIGDVAFDTTGKVYEKTGVTIWTERRDLVTAAELTSTLANYVLASALNELVDDRMQALLQPGNNITLTYDDTANTLTIASLIPNEIIDDRVAALLVAGSNITLSYDDTANVLTITSTVFGGSIPYTYNDADPPTASGQIRTLQASLNVATSIAINAADANGDSATDITARLKAGAIFTIAKDATNYVRLEATADYTSGAVAVVVRAEQGTIVTGDTVYLAIASDAPSTGGGGGGGMTWTESTADTLNLTANTGVIANSSNPQTFTVPAGAPIGTIQAIQGLGTGIWNLIGGTFYAPNGTNATGIRKLNTHRYAGVEIIKILSAGWAIRHPADLTGIELYNASADTRLTDYQTALAGQGYTMTTTEQTAFANLLTELDAITAWANVVCLYPMLGSTFNAARINAAAPAASSNFLTDINSDCTFNADGFAPGSGTFSGLSIPNALLTARLTNTRFTTILASVKGVVPNTSTQPLVFSYDQSGAATYSLGLPATGVVAGIDQAYAGGTAGHSYGGSANPNPFTGNFVLKAEASASNILGTCFRTGTASGSSTQARGTISSSGVFYLMNNRFNNKMTPGRMRTFIIISTTAGLSNTQAQALSTADVNFQAALGR